LPLSPNLVTLQRISAIVPAIFLKLPAIYPNSLAIYPDSSTIFMTMLAIYPKSLDKSVISVTPAPVA
jgi:hypothetical protein